MRNAAGSQDKTGLRARLIQGLPCQLWRDMGSGWLCGHLQTWHCEGRQVLRPGLQREGRDMGAPDGEARHPCGRAGVLNTAGCLPLPVGPGETVRGLLLTALTAPPCGWVAWERCLTQARG